MAIYSYRATTLKGEILEGAIEAADQKAAVERLKVSGLIPLKISAAQEGFKKKLSWRSAKGDLLTFTTELSVLLNAGLPLDRGLNILAEILEKPETQAVVQAILKSIREGSSFSDALQRHPKMFSRLYVNMVRAGESGGVLDAVLEIGTQQQCRLLETLAARIAATILQRFPVRQVTVRATKPAPPLPGVLGGASVEITRP
jgi:general secretion pathway protein F